MTTLIVYPDAGTGATTMDAYIRRTATSESLAAIFSGAGTLALPSQTQANAPKLGASTTTDEYNHNARSIFLFDTSPIGSGQAVDSAVLDIYVTNAPLTGLGDAGVDVCSSNPASDNDCVVGDYGTFGSTSFSSISLSSIASTSYNSFTLNATGEAAIAMTGITKLGMKLDWDGLGGTNPTWASGAISQINTAYVDIAGTTQDPKLTVEYSVSASAEDALFFSHNF